VRKLIGAISQESDLGLSGREAMGEGSIQALSDLLRIEKGVGGGNRLKPVSHQIELKKTTGEPNLPGSWDRVWVRVPAMWTVVLKGAHCAEEAPESLTLTFLMLWSKPGAVNSRRRLDHAETDVA
jgi:hypothetical protein